MKFADVWIWTADLWCWKRPLYQLSHNHCQGSYNLFKKSILAVVFNFFRRIRVYFMGERNQCNVPLFRVQSKSQISILQFFQQRQQRLQQTDKFFLWLRLNNFEHPWTKLDFEIRDFLKLIKNFLVNLILFETVKWNSWTYRVELFTSLQYSGWLLFVSKSWWLFEATSTSKWTEKFWQL